MTTTRKLCEVLADALGIEREVVMDHANALREAGLFSGGDDDRAEPEHASAILISLMAGVPPAKAPDAVQLYGGLPLDHVTRCELMPDGQFETVRVGDDDPFMDDLAVLGETFGNFLASLVLSFNEISEVNIKIGEIVVGGGTGTATASIQIFILAEGVDVGSIVQFTLAPLGGPCCHPDDAPSARLDCFSRVPGSIFHVFRKFFTGNADAPRKAIMSRAEVAALVAEK